MEIKNILNEIGNKASDLSINIFNKVSSVIGIESSSLAIRLLTIIILGSLLLLTLKISQKVVKIILLILIPLLIISIIYTMF